MEMKQINDMGLFISEICKQVNQTAKIKEYSMSNVVSRERKGPSMSRVKLGTLVKASGLCANFMCREAGRSRGKVLKFGRCH